MNTALSVPLENSYQKTSLSSGNLQFGEQEREMPYDVPFMFNLKRNDTVLFIKQK